MNDWIKPGIKVYLKSFSGWVKTGYTTIAKVDGDTFFLQRDPRIKVNIDTMKGDFLEFKEICQVYQYKEDLERKNSYINKRQIIKERLCSLTEEEIETIYNIVIKNNEHV